jgi:ribosomal protein S18 acetylase RimI-like enzyme
MNPDLSIVKVDRERPPNFWREIASLHQEEIQEGFLSTLGQEFLARLYAAVVQSDDAFLLAALVGNAGKVAGFICGSTDTNQVMRDCIFQSGFRLIPPLLPRVLSLRTVSKILETLRYSRHNGSSALPKAEILNFCVSRGVQRQGVGRRLFGALISEFKRRGVDQIKIVTGESQVTARRFYEAIHARQIGNIEVHTGARSVVFLYQIV